MTPASSNLHIVVGRWYQWLDGGISSTLHITLPWPRYLTCFPPWNNLNASAWIEAWTVLGGVSTHHRWHHIWNFSPRCPDGNTELGALRRTVAFTFPRRQSSAHSFPWEWEQNATLQWLPQQNKQQSNSFITELWGKQFVIMVNSLMETRTKNRTV